MSPKSLRSSSSSSTLSSCVDTRATTPDLSFQTEEMVPESLNLPAKFVLVLGGLGFIGSHTALELLEEGHNVVIVDDLSNSFGSVLDRIKYLAAKHWNARGEKMPQLHFAQLDYRSPAMRQLFTTYTTSEMSISAIIHFAAFKSVSESISTPLAYYRNNICGLVDLLIMMEEFGIDNFIFSSSATVYGDKCNRGEPLMEHDLVHFDEATTGGSRLNGALGLQSPYGRTKYFAEAILADLARANPSIRITALRYFNPVGCHSSGLLLEDPRQRPTNLFPVVASVIKGDQDELAIFGSDWNTRDGTAVRDFIHVVDLARGHVAALRAAWSSQRSDAFRAYNLGSGTGMTVQEVVTSFEAASGKVVPAVRTCRRAGDVGSCVASTTRAESELGWRTIRSVDQCAADTWAAIVKNQTCPPL